MSELVWPERQRCRACRKYFGFIVLRRLYCSYECAGLPEPDPDARPRQCFSKVPWIGLQPKRAFFSLEAARANHAAQKDQTLNAYECSNCLMYHLGHEYIEMSTEDFLKLVRQRRVDKAHGEAIKIQEHRDNLLKEANHIGMTPEQMIEVSTNGRLLDPEAERIRLAERNERRRAKKKRNKRNAKARSQRMEHLEPWQLKLLQMKPTLECPPDSKPLEERA